MEKLRPSLLVL
ncbi:hypothetical protein CP8484711_1849A, partial [Chlamydia psittaci 84-8471/1]